MIEWKNFTRTFIFLTLFLSALSAHAINNPYNADIVVALDGSGNFTKIQDAINAVPDNSERRTVIYIKRGLYNTEKLIIPAGKNSVTFIGESREETIISYHIYDCSSGKCPTADAAKWTGENIRTSATLTLQANGFRAENLTIQNTAGPVGQALAITVIGDKNVFINCNLLGYQDTIYLWQPGKRSYFENCLVQGRTDYIYGAGIGFFQACEIRSWGGGWITAPSTPREQTYGYVFNECRLTYAVNSPRAGDDGAKVALGRPWHEYPHVVWMNSEMTDMIDPLGWPTTWNMDYAATSPDLKLYEYNNTGGGADMSGRANWVGIRALTDAEAANYTVEKVMAGTDGWNPAAEAPLVQKYTWAGAAVTKGWLLANNWNPSAVPATGEAAEVDGGLEVTADGGSFVADLSLANGATLNVTANSTVNYLSIGGSAITAATDATLGGKISTKGVNRLSTTGVLTLSTILTGVHQFTKEGTGKVILTADNTNYSGAWIVNEGTIEASAANALGKGSINVSSGATLVLGNGNALQPQSQLKVVTGSALVLNADVTLNEFYIDNVMQPVGEYTAVTNATLISGTGKIVVGRPSTFNFVGGTDGKWDNPAHFSPQLMPEAGETVIVGREIETTSTVFPAKIVLTNTGTLRLRGVHTATGEVEMQTDSRIYYATSGTGFTLNAPVHVAGNISMQMNSSNTAGSAMVLTGNIRGSGKATAMNTRSSVVNEAKLVLSGNNSGFTGIWDLTRPSASAGSKTIIEGTSANAFGAGKVEVASNNKVVFGHARSAGDALNLTVSEAGKAVLNADVVVKSFTLNGAEMSDGTYSATTHADIFEGTGSIIVSNTVTSVKKDVEHQLIHFADKTLYINGAKSLVTVYTMTGTVKVKESSEKAVSFNGFKPGLYIVRYQVDGSAGVAKIVLN